MKIKELIEKLKEFDQELEVWVRTCCELQKTDVAEESLRIEEDRNTGKYLIISSDGELR